MSNFTGKDLIELGYKPEPWFKSFLEEVGKRHLSRSQAIRAAVEAKTFYDAAQPKVIPLQPGVDFVVNITAENEDEQRNMDAVVSGFRELVRTPTVVAGAIMPDACPTDAGSIPVGGVIAAKNAIHPGMHSADICCSMYLTIVDADPKDVLDAMASVTHFGPGGRQDKDERFKVSDELLAAFRKNAFLDNGKAIGVARAHMGTQGDGNHFTYVGLNGKGQTVLVTHHGSRGVGGFLYKVGMKAAKEHTAKVSPETSLKNAWIPADSRVGEAYWDALMVLRAWTKENHRVLHDAALGALGLSPVDRFWNPHNFVFRDDDVFWHAKGATPIHNPFNHDSAGKQIIPMNMAQPVLIVEGERNDNNLGFAPHGAGRNLSRSAHKRSKGDTPISEIFKEETKGLDARFHSGKIDISELPSAYKDADSVQRDMERFGLARVVDKVQPFGCIMAGEQEPEPWLVAKMEKKRRALAEAPSPDF